MLIIMTLSRGVLRTPVNLGNNNRVGINYRHLLMELLNLVLRIGIGIAAAIPSSIVMNGITDVIALDRISSITGIVGLPSSTRRPDNTRKAVFADLIDDRLEIVMERFGIVLILGISQVNRFVGQLNTNLTGMILHKFLLREHIPYIHQILIIIIAHLQVMRTYTGRAYYYVHTIFHSHLGQFQI